MRERRPLTLLQLAIATSMVLVPVLFAVLLIVAACLIALLVQERFEGKTREGVTAVAIFAGDSLARRCLSRIYSRRAVCRFRPGH